MAQDTLTEFPHLKETLEEYGQELRNRYQDELIKKNKIASGELLNSLEFEVSSEGSKFFVTLDLAHYWKYVEKGRKPNGKFPPIDAIREWVKVKPVIPKPREGRLPTLNQLSYLIARSIAVHGIKPTNALENSQKDINATYLDKIVEAFAQDVAEGAQGLLSILSD